MNYLAKSALFITATLILTGCATIRYGTQQQVAVNTGTVKDAKCTLSNSKGIWTVNNTPGDIKIKRGPHPLQVTCLKNGYAPKTLIFKSKVSPMLLGDIALPGGSAAAVIDYADGAAFRYPDVISVPLN